MEVKLWKKTGTYFNEEKKKDKPFTNFYVQCNDKFIPVEVKYFPNVDFGNRDPGYQGRFQVLSAFAELMPEKKKLNLNVILSSRKKVKICHFNF